MTHDDPQEDDDQFVPNNDCPMRDDDDPLWNDDYPLVTKDDPQGEKACPLVTNDYPQGARCNPLGEQGHPQRGNYYPQGDMPAKQGARLSPIGEELPPLPQNLRPSAPPFRTPCRKLPADCVWFSGKQLSPADLKYQVIIPSLHKKVMLLQGDLCGIINRWKQVTVNLPQKQPVTVRRNIINRTRLRKMKNIKLNIDDQIFSAVMRYAAAHNRSVNTLVSEYFAEIANREYQLQKARRKLTSLSVQSKARIGSKSWKRSDLYER